MAGFVGERGCCEVAVDSDLDVSRFIRSGEERDVYVCWTDLDWEAENEGDKNPPATVQPLRDGLCPVPVYRVKKWLFVRGKLKDKCRAWVWSYLDSKWVPLTEDKCYPGQILLVDSTFGGYDPTRGFTGEQPAKKDPPVEVADGIENRENSDLSDYGQNRDDRSKQGLWKTIATHGVEVAQYVTQLSESLKLDDSLTKVLRLAALWHDLGKVHPAFQYNIVLSTNDPPRSDFAKAPNWVAYRAKEFSCPERNRESDISYGKRRGFRHELASVLALFEVLARFNPKHDALLGPYRKLVEKGVLQSSYDETFPLEEQTFGERLNQLTAAEFNLLVYLVCCHHGKVRGTWQATPQDQKFPYENKKLVGHGLPLRGIREGDPLPAVELPLPDGEFATLPELTLHLDLAAVGLSSRYGASWTDDP